MKTLNRSSLKGIIRIFFILVLTIKCYDLFVDRFSFSRFSDVEKTGEETKTPDPDESTAKKSGKDLFSFFETGLGSPIEPGVICSSDLWRIYSLVIFKEPLRDVLTPPPNYLAA